MACSKAVIISILLVIFVVLMGYLYGHSFGEAQVSTVTVEVSGSSGQLNKEKIKLKALREAYVLSLEKGLNTTIAGETADQKFMMALDFVLRGKKAYVKSYEVVSFDFSPQRYSLSMKAEVRKGDMSEDLEGLKIITDLIVNPKVLVIIDEANLGKHVMRSVAESQMNRRLSLLGYSIIDHHLDVLDKLMDRKKQLEDKKLVERKEITFSPQGTERNVTESINYTVDYYNLVIGYGNEKVAYDYAKERGADILILGGIYTEEVDIASALPSATKSSFRSVRAYSTIRAVVLRNQSILTAEALEATKMDLSPTTAGNEAIRDLADKIVKDIIVNIPLKAKL